MATFEFVDKNKLVRSCGKSIDDFLIDHLLGNILLPKCAKISCLFIYFQLFVYHWTTWPRATDQHSHSRIERLELSKHDSIRKKKKKLFLGKSRKLFSWHKWKEEERSFQYLFECLEFETCKGLKNKSNLMTQSRAVLLICVCDYAPNNLTL